MYHVAIHNALIFQMRSISVFENAPSKAENNCGCTYKDDVACRYRRHQHIECLDYKTSTSSTLIEIQHLQTIKSRVSKAT